MRHPPVGAAGRGHLYPHPDWTSTPVRLCTRMASADLRPKIRVCTRMRIRERPSGDSICTRIRMGPIGGYAGGLKRPHNQFPKGNRNPSAQLRSPKLPLPTTLMLHLVTRSHACKSIAPSLVRYLSRTTPVLRNKDELQLPELGSLMAGTSPSVYAAIVTERVL